MTKEEQDKKIRQAFLDVGGFGIEKNSEPVDVLIAHFYGQSIKIREMKNLLNMVLYDMKTHGKILEDTMIQIKEKFMYEII